MICLLARGHCLIEGVPGLATTLAVRTLHGPRKFTMRWSQSQVQDFGESGKVLAVKGTIVPSTLQDVTLVASINGSNVEGESKIPKQNGKISQVFLKPDGAQVNPGQVLVILVPRGSTTYHPPPYSKTA